MKSFDEYSVEINLVDFLIWLPGFKFIQKNSKRGSDSWRYAEFKNPNDETIVVMRRTEPPYKWFYKNRVNDMDKGNIVNILKPYCSNDFKKINSLLQEFSGGVSSQMEPYIPEVINFDIKVVPELNRGKCGGREYLLKRGIDGGVLNSPYFKGSIWSDKYDNAIFPLYNSKGEIKGLEQRNFESLFFLGKSVVKNSEKAGTFWYSNYDPSIHVDHIFIGEAPIDLLSYYKLNGVEAKNPLFLATNGAFSGVSLAHLKTIVDSNPGVKVTTCFDEDLVGCKYMLILIKFFIKGEKPSFAFVKSKGRFVVDWNTHLTYSGFRLRGGLEVKLDLGLVQEFGKWVVSQLPELSFLSIGFPKEDYNSMLMEKEGLSRKGLIKYSEGYYNSLVGKLNAQLNKADFVNSGILQRRLEFAKARREEIMKKIVL